MPRRRFKLGRIGRPHGAKALVLHDYCTGPLPPPPVAWQSTFGASFPLHRNDRYRDCTCAALSHLASAQAAGIGLSLGFTDAAVVDYYLGLTGGRDEGAVMLDVLDRVWRDGFPATGAYRIAGYAEVRHRDIDAVKRSAAAFTGLYVGAQLPLAADDEQPWTVVAGERGMPGSWGGHAMALVGFDQCGVTLATWGRLQRADWAWWSTYVDECYATLDDNRRYAHPLDWEKLRADMAALSRQD